MKRLLSVLVVLAVAWVGAVPARAGTGPATACDDQPPPGATKIPVFNDPLLGHLTIEVRADPALSDVAICYSDRPSGTPSVAYGGFVLVRVESNGNFLAWCLEDSSAVIKCNGTPAAGTISPSDLPALKTTSTCAVYAQGSCRLYIDAPSVVLFDGAPISGVTILNTPIVNDPGRICVGFAC